MITLKFKDFQNPHFLQAFEKVVKHTGFGPKAAYNISRIAAKLDQGLKHMQEEYIVLLKKYSHLDEKGNLSPINGEGTFVILDEKKEDWTKAYHEFMDIEYTIERHLIDLDALEGVGLSAYDIMALGPVLNTNDEVPCKVLPLQGE